MGLFGIRKGAWRLPETTQTYIITVWCIKRADFVHIAQPSINYGFIAALVCWPNIARCTTLKLSLIHI